MWFGALSSNVRRDRAVSMTVLETRTGSPAESTSFREHVVCSWMTIEEGEQKNEEADSTGSMMEERVTRIPEGEVIVNVTAWESTTGADGDSKVAFGFGRALGRRG